MIEILDLYVPWLIELLSTLCMLELYTVVLKKEEVDGNKETKTVVEDKYSSTM